MLKLWVREYLQFYADFLCLSTPVHNVNVNISLFKENGPAYYCMIHLYVILVLVAYTQIPLHVLLTPKLARGLNFVYTHILRMRAAMLLGSLRMCADSPEPSLLVDCDE